VIAGADLDENGHVSLSELNQGIKKLLTVESRYKDAPHGKVTRFSYITPEEFENITDNGLLTDEHDELDLNSFEVRGSGSRV
jgi:hypothetical protein